jgi:nucleotide-binding universal stress UspA family protein
MSVESKLMARYAVIMAAIDLDMPSRGVLVATEKLATIFNARVIGAAAGECSLSPYFAEGPAADQYLEASQAELHAQFKMLEKKFRRAHVALADRIEWRCAERLPDRFLLAASRSADCVVTARPSPHGNLLRGPDVAHLLMQAGRPVLVVSPEAKHFSLDRVLVAWKDTRESRRAASDALPILAQAKEVHILAIPEPETSEASTLAGADDVVNWLARHGIHAVAIARPAFGSIGNSIEAAASEIGADLIVAGAYGHSRFTEWLLGGVTQHLLRYAKANVLFSH